MVTPTWLRGHRQNRASAGEVPRLLGVIGDPHAEDRALESAITWLRSRGAQQLVCTGDVVDGTGDVERTIDLLRAHQVLTVRGNHDRWHTERHATTDQLGTAHAAWLAGLPATVRLPTTLGSVLLCHSVGEDDLNHLRLDDYGYAVEQNDALQQLLTSRSQPTLMIRGHTHHGGVARFGRLAVLDAGTLRADHDPQVWLVDTRDRTATCWSLADDQVRPDSAVTHAL